MQFIPMMEERTGNWSGSTPTDQVNECILAELKKGKLLLNMRNYNQIRFRQTSTSDDGGMNWKTLVQDTSLPEPVCQASLIRLWNDKKASACIFKSCFSKEKGEHDHQMVI